MRHLPVRFGLHWRLRPATALAALKIAGASALATVHAAGIAQASCSAIEGDFLITGETLEHEVNTRRPTRHLEASLDPGLRQEAHHFHYKVDPNTATSTSIVFNAAGVQLMASTQVSSYVCRNGQLVYERRVDGGSEGCSKSGRVATTLSIGPRGELLFSTVEHWDFGWLCFSKPMENHRTTSFERVGSAAK